MKSIILVALALVAVAVAAPTEPFETLRSDFQQQPDGPYSFNFETNNGIKRDEVGELKDALDENNKPHPVVVVRGSYTYPGDDGKPIVVNYYADENGYHADGDTIPNPPKIF